MSLLIVYTLHAHSFSAKKLPSPKNVDRLADKFYSPYKGTLEAYWSLITEKEFNYVTNMLLSGNFEDTKAKIFPLL